MAPAAARTEWRSRWDFRLQNLCILIERGDVPAHLSAHAPVLCRDAFVNAFRLRFPLLLRLHNELIPDLNLFLERIR